MTWAKLALSILQAFPIVQKWIIWGFKLWAKLQFEEKVAAAIVTLIERKDQRELERLIGYVNAGKPSGIPGSVIVDELPGVPKLPDPKTGGSGDLERELPPAG